MQRSFNYTNRRTIKEREVRFSILSAGGALTLVADLSQLKSADFPAAAKVYVEAYRQTSWKRFDFGTIDELRPPPDLRLEQFSSPEALLFRVYVVDPQTSLIIGVAEQVPLRTGGDQAKPRRSLLPVQGDRLNSGEVYRVTFEHGPVLIVDNSIGSATDIARSAGFRALVYPAVLREVLFRILMVDGGFDEDSQTWGADWVRFVRTLGVIESVPDDGDREAIAEWIDSAVAALARATQAQAGFKQFWEAEA